MFQFIGYLCGLWNAPSNYKNLLYIKKIVLQLNKGIVSVAAGSDFSKERQENAIKKASKCLLF